MNANGLHTSESGITRTRSRWEDLSGDYDPGSRNQWQRRNQDGRGRPWDERDSIDSRARPSYEPDYFGSDYGPEDYDRMRSAYHDRLSWRDSDSNNWASADEGPYRMPRGYKRSDERIIDDVCEHLSRNRLDVEDVSVQVEDGHVTLSGTVRSRRSKHQIEDVTASCFGVEDISNQISVRRGNADTDQE